MSSKQKWLSDYQVQVLNERHGWFKHGDGQSDVSRAFANDAVEAHERLRAAAPELLESLIAARQEIRALVAACGEGVCTEAVLAAADSAIAKATGAA